MKVVIFCGGLGVRMGEETRRIPKPMIEIGGKPILWHIMRYYSMWGHDDFILCLGYKGDVVKQFFLSYNGALLNDFVLDHDAATGTKVELLSRDLDKWRITFVDTGMNATIGERLKAVAPFIGDDESFLATYGDGLTDAPLTQVIHAFQERGKKAMFLSVRPQYNAHLVTADADGNVLGVEDLSRSDVRINGGFFVLKREVVDLIEPGDELVEETFARLIAERELIAYPYDGFFQAMDTIKDRQSLENLHESGQAPWRRVPDVGLPIAVVPADVRAEAVSS
jgi:glucose-1-phosphate cytidylyltransferase